LSQTLSFWAIQDQIQSPNFSLGALRRQIAPRSLQRRELPCIARLR
jgi:hypothetical protein